MTGLHAGPKTAAWLQSEYSASTWVIKDTGKQRDRTITFDIGLADGTRLVEHTNLYETIKRITFSVRSGQMQTVESGSEQAGIANVLLNIVRWMNSEAIYHFSDISINDVECIARQYALGVGNLLNVENTLRYWITGIQGFRKNPDDAAFVWVSALQKEMNKLQLLDYIGFGPGVLNSGKKGQIASTYDSLYRLYLGESLEEGSKCDEGAEVDQYPISSVYLGRILGALRLLYLHRLETPDALLFDPYPDGVARASEALGAEVRRTRSIPVQQGAWMIERSIRWVLDYAPDILSLAESAHSIHKNSKIKVRYRNIAELFSKFEPVVRGVTDPWPIYGMSGGSRPGEEQPTMSLRQAIKFLQVACAVVIAAFSARRISEIAGLSAGCIRNIDGQRWMGVFIHKTLLENDVVPVPEIVEKAIQVMTRLSASAREKSGDDRLFQYSFGSLHLSANNAASQIGRTIQKFGFYLDVPEWKGERWLFKMHQFRRFFAIVYVYIYELGDFGALSYHLRHFNPEMTRRYVRDEELGQILAYTNREHTASILTRAALGEIRIGGPASQRLYEKAKKILNELNGTVRVSLPERLEARIMRMLEREDVRMVPTPWGLCGCTDSQLAPCHADRGGGPAEMDLSRATARNCSNCMFSLRTPEFLPIWRESLRRHTAVWRSIGSAGHIQVWSAYAADCIRGLIREME